MVISLIVMVALLSTFIPLWMGARYGAVRLVSPMHLLGYFCGFGFLIKVIVFSYTPEYAFYQRFIETPGALLKGALYLGGFVVALCLGYRIAVQPFSKDHATNEARRIAAGIIGHWWLFFAAFAVAALTILMLLQARDVSLFALDLLSQMNADKQINVNAEGVGATLAGIKTLFVIPKFAFVLLLAHGIVLQRALVLGKCVVLAGLLILIALMSGDRFELVELLIYTIATYLILGGRVGLRSALLAVCALAAVLLLSGYMTVLRGSEAGLLHQIVGSTYFLDINAAVMVTDRVTPAMYLWGESYGWWSFGWVPRALWVDKPAIDLGVFFKRDVMGLMTGGAFNVTGPGEAFINFGWAGVLVGVALGWIFRKLEVAFLSAQNALLYGAFFLYPILFYPFIQAALQSSFSAFIVGAAAQFVLICGMIKLCVPRYFIHPVLQVSRGGIAHA